MGFSFDGTASKYMGIASKMSKENRVPELRNRTVEMPGRDGLLDLGSSLSERIIEISCLIPPQNTQTDFLECKDRVIDWLNPGKGVCELVLDTEPERYYKARLKGGVSFERIGDRAATFDLTFFCPDPYGYAIEDETFSITETGMAVQIIREKGNLDSQPVYAIKGTSAPNTDSVISISVNGTAVQIVNAWLTGDETLMIDTAKMTAWVADENNITRRNALPYLRKIEFPVLRPGHNSVLVAVQNATFTSLTIQARSRWR